MKKSPRVLSIISLLLTVLAGVLFVYLPKMAFETLQFAPTWYNNGAILLSSKAWVGRFYTNILGSLVSTFTLKGAYPIYYILLIVLTCGVAIFWLWHFILLCAKRRPGALVFNLFWLIFGAANLCVFYSYIGYVDGKEGLMFNASGISDGFGLIAKAFQDNHPMAAVEVLLPFVIVCLSAYLFLIGMLISLHDIRKHPGHSKKQETPMSDIKESDVKNAAPKQDAMSDAQEQEMKNVPLKDNAKESYVVQNFSYGMPMPSPYMPPYPPRPEERPSLTEDDVRRVVTEVLLQNQPKPEPAVSAPAAEKPVATADRPLTAKELRHIIQDELRDHDHPEDLMPLTDEQCRN